jgi:hypothetical protein
VALVQTGGAFSTANDTTQIANLFNGGVGVDPLSLGANQKGILLTGSGSTTVYVWFIENDGTTAVTASEVKAAGTITLLAGEDITDFHTSNFSFAAIPPIVFDLDGDGAEFLSLTHGVTFDYAGNGHAEATAWAGADDGILSVDLNGDGKISDAAEFVFGGNGLTDLQGLALNYDSNHDGVLDALDAGFAKFGVWQDANSNGVSEAGEFKSLAEMGITSVKLTSDGVSYEAANGDVIVHGTTTYTRTDGTTGAAADASFATDADRQARTAELVQAATAASGVIAAAIAAVSDAPEAEAATAPAASNDTAPAASAAPALPAIEAPAHVEAALGQADAQPLAPQHQASQGEAETQQATSLTAAAEHAPAPAPAADQADAHEGPAHAPFGAGAFDFGGNDGHLMDALLTANLTAPQASTPAPADAVAAVQDALGDTLAGQTVDAVIEHFAGTEAAPAAAPSQPAALESLLLAQVGPGADAHHFVPLPTVDHHDAALIAAA